MLIVYHNNSFIECALNTQLKEGMILSHVAVVNSDDLEEGYRLTNNIDRPWPENSGVKCLTKNPRSTSVGDVILHEDSYYIVESCGFRRVSKEEIAQVTFLTSFYA